MCLKMILSFFLCLSMFSSPMIGPHKNKLGAYSAGESSVDQEENSFDFMNYYLKKFTQEITKSDGTQETIQLKSPITMRPDHCYSTLHEASIANDEKGIERLLQLDEHKERLNGFDLDGQTPLQCAIDYSADKAIICLIKYGAHADVKNQAGQYTARTLAKAYFESKIFTNVVPFMALEHALAKRGELYEHASKREKTVHGHVSSKIPGQSKPSRIKRRRPRRVATPEYAPLPDEDEYDPYMLNL